MRKLGAFAAACRRIALLLALSFCLLLAWIYYQAPSLDALRPELESLLRQELNLKALRLGHLSWYWAGHVWVQADGTSLTTANDYLDVRDADLAVRIRSWDLLRGRTTPDRIRIQGGNLALRLPEQSHVRDLPLPAMQLQLDDVELSWRRNAYAGRLTHLSLNLNVGKRRLSLQLPGANLQLGWSKDLRPKQLRARFEDMHWLPQAWRQYLDGDSSGEIEASDNGGEWALRLRLWAKTAAVIKDDQGHALLPFEHLQAFARVHLSDGSLAPVRLRLEDFSWQEGENRLNLAGSWQQGELEARLLSGELAMTTLWPWLRGLGEETWRAWLQAMHEGRAENLEGSLSMAWPELFDLPSLAQWQQAKFTLRGDVEDADIALNIGGKPLTHVWAAVSAGDTGLQASIRRATLPLGVGQVHGRLRLRDWQTPLLEVEGEGEVEVDRLQSWLDVNPLAQLHWRAARAHGRFSLKWMPEEPEPRAGEATLVPVGAWRAQLFDMPVEVSDGRVIWNAEAGIRAEDFAFETDLLRGTLNVHSIHHGGEPWGISSLNIKAEGDFARLVSRLSLPVRAPQGSVRVAASYGGRWRLGFAFDEAGWQHFLGSSKRKGERFSINVLGEYRQERFNMIRIASRGKALSLEASGMIGLQDWHIRVQRLLTPASDIAVLIQAPAGQAPVAVDIDAEYFNEGFLPDPLPKQAIGSRPWTMHARAKRVQWGSASMQGIDLQMASANLGVGLLHADVISAANLTIDHVRSIFYRPSAGIMDVRSLSANLLGQHLDMSAVLTSEGSKGIRWSGFAQISGDFTPLVQRLDAEQHFRGGKMRALVSGRGRLLPDQPWWRDLDGRLRLRVDNGRILEGGPMTRLLAAASLADLPRILTLDRKDLVGEGILYKRLQMEAEMHGNETSIRELAMRSSALDMAGHGSLDLSNGYLDLLMVMRPLQNLDAVIGAIPLLRDVLGGASRSLLRKIYHVHGPLSQAKVETMEPEAAGLAAPGLIERLITWPGKWFGRE